MAELPPFQRRAPVPGVPRPVVLIILDGFGEAPVWGGNAVASAMMPNIIGYLKDYPHSSLDASGQAVGLPPRTQGNSEAGHLNLGAGRIVKQDFSYISAQIKDEHFFSNSAFLGAIAHAEKNQSHLHLLGLVSEGGVHSHSQHLYALLELIKRQQVKVPVLIHCFTDGRDAAPDAGLTEILRLEQRLKDMPQVRIATICGRYYAMDRDNRWDRTSLAWQAIALAKGQVQPTAIRAIQAAYHRGLSDEFIAPTVIAPSGQAATPVQDNDAFIFFNFRPDRSRQLTKAFLQPDFEKMKITKVFKNIFFVTFVRYEESIPAVVAFHPEYPKEPLAAVLSRYGLTQFHIAETEKYAHITYFFNGGREESFPGEERQLVPSLKVATYDKQPEMAAPEIARLIIDRVETHQDDFIVANFANADMVGHTGNFSATVKALETVDQLLGTVVQTVWQKQGTVFVTADHGNAEEMLNPHTGFPDTEHSMNPVPFIYLPADTRQQWPLRKHGILADVAPTILHLLRCPLGSDMNGVSLFLLDQQSVVPTEATSERSVQPTTVVVGAGGNLVAR